MQSYLERLVSCGMSYDDAVVIVSDFLHDLDWTGLDAYCREIESLHYMEV